MQAHRVAAPGEGVALGVGMIEIEHAALADHRVVVEILLQPFPQLHRAFVEGIIAGQQIVGADDRRVAAGIAGADPALFQHRDVGDAVLLGEVIGGRKAMAAAADDDDVIGRLRRGIAPDRRPMSLACQGVPGQRPCRISHPGSRAQQSSVVSRSHSVRWRE